MQIREGERVLALKAARPTPWGAMVFRGKVLGLQGVRLGRDLRRGPRRHPVDRGAEFEARLEHRSALRTSDNPAELALQLGKIQNLRIAARRLDGVVVPADEAFGFWRQIGRATRRRGFVDGRELREGCTFGEDVALMEAISRATGP